MRATRRRWMTWWLAWLTLLVPLGSIAAESSIDAVWKPQRATFVYVGQTTFFTCEALQQKLTLVLRVIGAHEDMTFDRRDCKNGGRTRLQVTFRSPIAATPENLRALTTYDTEQEIVSRLNGATLPTAADLEHFPASWQQISFAIDRRLRLSASDCEFVEHVRRQLLPHIAAQVIENRIFCTPGSHAVRAPNLKISALIASK
jgi:hypothetical protein